MNPLRNAAFFIFLGVLVWLSFLVAMRLIGSTVFSTGDPLLAVFFVAALPLIAVVIAGIAVLIRVPIRHMLVPVVIMTFTALMFDGVAVGFTDFYGSTDDQVRASAAYLLWGAGAGLLVVWVLGRAEIMLRQDATAGISSSR